MDQLQIEQVNYAKEKININNIRTLVFQIEQGVTPELEFDGQDETAIHLLAYCAQKPVGTLRIRHIDPKTVKIERLAVLQSARHQGIGKKLLQKALDIAQNELKIEKVIVNAQEYIKKLYDHFGFQQFGDSFFEAGILHIKMIKQFPPF
ncbi:GNAT family N-acetyltransferase [Gloeothece verrucosa]|uniref:GCN5-related N-acetyltransferase n=1 Tax=Gloeothece verrucosa (strain PCC 7822) TaxID=497965 RepID=E0UL34_GLOV7|nr:GNAT family N-acetyltransferase [Gloeothece verrucosa]ADN17664.1 GCN5-related N-acetyltransferase [Gloeothece verrucosa PCC 7822]